MVYAIEYRAMPNLLEQKNNLIQSMEQMVEKGKTEKRSFSASEKYEFDKMKAQVEEINKELAKEDRIFEGQQKIHISHVSEEERSFIRFCQSGEIRDLSTSGSGVVIPKTIAQRVVSRVKELAPIYARMTHFNVVGDLSVPTYDFTAHTTAFITEFTEITATGGSFLTVNLKSYPLGTLAKIGKSLLNRSDLDVINIIVEQMAMSIANFISNEVINNTNAKFSGTLLSVSQNVTGALNPDNLIALQMAVPSQYQNNSAWLMHPSTFATIRQMKATDGTFLMVSDSEGFGGDLGYRLLGRPVLLDENMALSGAGARSIYYGAFNGLYCNSSSGLIAQVLLEKYADQYAVGIVATQELDINLAEPRALAVLIGA